MSEKLSRNELVALVERVFHPVAEDRNLAILVDLPSQSNPDNADWKARRQMTADWVNLLQTDSSSLDLRAQLYVYESVRANNAGLPCQAWVSAGGSVPEDCEEAQNLPMVAFDALLKENSIVLAPTEFSATAPLKLLAKAYGFRAATMPGFSATMIPALRIDYSEVNRRVDALKVLLDKATSASLIFKVDDGEEFNLTMDLRFRMAHASGGLIREPGTAGNLPSGETYIVPYEGEIPGQKSLTSGFLPVQFGSDVVIYEIDENRARTVAGEGRVAERETERLKAEPAYANLAELGFGVLADFGIEPCGSVLLDEKLGLHIAFGRSDHFGGQVGPEQFSTPDAVIHIDRVYLPSLQPRIHVSRVELHDDSGGKTLLMKDANYEINFGS